MSSPTGQLGPYVLIRELGEGAHAKVRLAMNTETREQVAIKMIRRESFSDKPELYQKIQREITLMRLFDHPHILKVVDYLESPKHIYIVLEYASKGELFDYLVERASLDEGSTREFLRQIIYGLEYLHSLGICHRDIKPENILLDANLNVKIADFGFARFVKSSIAETSCGSPHYAAPEIVKGGPYNGKAADVWSCGVVVYALIAGSLPFDDLSIRGLLVKVRRGQFAMPQCSPLAQDLIARMLTVDPAQRITIDGIKAHPFFRADLPADYVLPRPVAMRCMDEPLDPSTISPEIVDGLHKIGYHDEAELAADLQSPTHTMAKVFYFMLNSRFYLELVDWTQSAGGDAPAAEPGQIMYDGQSAFAFGGSDPFHREPGEPSPGSIGAVNSLAVQGEWDIPSSELIEQSYKVNCTGVSVIELMRGLQALVTQHGMQWMHPDDFTILARHEASGLYVLIQAWLAAHPGNIELALQLYRGTGDQFETLCRAVDDAFAG